MAAINAQTTDRSTRTQRRDFGSAGIVESIRAGLVFQLKREVGIDVIRTREDQFVQRALASWSKQPGLHLLGNVAAERLPIVSFLVRSQHEEDERAQYLHHGYVVALLSDLFGIQARGGCSCAGPYGHRLLGIDLARSHGFERQISAGVVQLHCATAA